MVKECDIGFGEEHKSGRSARTGLKTGYQKLETRNDAEKEKWRRETGTALENGIGAGK